MSDHFRPDNTSGYSLEELAELNRRLDAAIAAAEPIAADIREHVIDHYAEQVLAEYDQQKD